MGRRSINLTQADIEALEELKEYFDAGTLNDTIRRSIAQSSLLKRYADEDQVVTVMKDGREIHLLAK